MPGPTETEFFARAGMLDTPVGESEKADPAKVAADGWMAMTEKKPHVVSGFVNKLQAAMSHITPDSINAKLHTAQAKPNDEGESRGGM
jgi:short-subunit dehydrogenase